MPTPLILPYLARKYLSDPTEDVRVATENILADFLREIRNVTNVRKKLEEKAKAKQAAEDGETEQESQAEDVQAMTLATESTANSIIETELNSDIDFRDLGGKQRPPLLLYSC
jgi:vacuole morphology and inheritance protein 14